MAKRIAVVGVNVEYRESPIMRLSFVGTEVESRPDENTTRISAIGVMVDSEPWPPVLGSLQGPRVQ